MKNARHIRVDLETKCKFEDLCRKKALVDKKQIGMRDITRAMVKTNSFKEVEKELLQETKIPWILKEYPTKKKMGKRGNIADILIWLVVCFVVVTFFGLWMYGHNIVTETLTGIVGNSNVNISEPAMQTFGAINNSMPMLQTLSFGIMVAMAISILISNFLVRAHPVFFVIYFLISAVAVVFSVYLSNAYETLLSGQVFSDTLVGFSASNIILANLPVWTTIICLGGAIFLFIGMIRDDGLGGGVV
jgi:hypothetical protein